MATSSFISEHCDVLGAQLRTILGLTDAAIATITMTVSLPSDIVPVESSVDLPRLQALVQAEAATCKLIPKPSKRRFLNCVVYSVAVGHMLKCIKVFQNGTLHLTGVQCVEHVRAVLEATLPLVARCVGGPCSRPRPPPGFQVRMFNCYVSIGERVDMLAMRRVLFEQYDVPAAHDREKHPGLKFRAPKGGATVIVFLSGKVLVSGSARSSTIDELICDAHRFVTDVVRTHRAALFPSADLAVATTTGRKRGAEQSPARRRGRKPKKDHADAYDQLRALLKI